MLAVYNNCLFCFSRFFIYLDYFDNMLNNEWMEASLFKEQSLKMAVPEKILNVVIHYLYTDDVVMLRGEQIWRIRSFQI